MSFAADRGRPQFYVSLRSPYSWLAWHDLTTSHADELRRLQLIPFWEPDETSEAMLAAAGARFPYTPMTRAKHLYVLQDVRRLASARGLRPTWPADREPWWEVPHLAYVAAILDDPAAGPRWLDRLYRARWQDGLDICDRAVVARLAARAGLDPDRLANAVDDPGVRATGLEALLSVCRAGVFGVPYFVNGYERFWGVDRLEAFLASLTRQDEPESRQPEPVCTSAARTTDWGHAGGCG